MTMTPPPPSGDDQPEILDSTTGATLAGDQAEAGRGGRRTGLIVAGGVLGLALVGGGAWAATSFLATGDQPAQVLPADALGYVSVDLDPGGAQKIEAVRTLNKFPAFEDGVGISPETDVRKTFFDKALAETDCGLDYDADIEPWLGDRAAVAAVPGEDGAAEPLFVVQVTDADAADEGLTALLACGSDQDDQDDQGGWVVEGDWLVAAETEEIARAARESADRASLADDADFQRWTEETGDAGIMTMYAAPGAGQAILDGLGEQAPAEVGSQLADFQGLAATVRFADGALEIEGAGQLPPDADALGEDIAGSVADLPEDTAAVFGVSLGEGWLDQALQAFATQSGEPGDDLVAQLEQATGLSLPEDVETLTSGGLVLAVGPDLDPEALANAADPSQVPVALKLSGDAEEIQNVVTALQSTVPDGATVLGSSTDGDTVVVGPDADLRDRLLEDGALGEAETFTDVVPDGESPSILYVDVDAFDAAVESLAGGERQIVDNITPLRAIGATSTIDGDISRFTLTVTTD